MKYTLFQQDHMFSARALNSRVKFVDQINMLFFKLPRDINWLSIFWLYYINKTIKLKDKTKQT